jgi:hypothetical protein
MAVLDKELEAALKATEASFHVRLIGTFGTDLVSAPAQAKAAHWLTENGPDFDQFPVTERGATVGILFRGGNHDGRTVREAMQPIRDGLIVSADMSIADLIPQLRENHCRLVLRGGSIDGLVTQSDLLKLPVRMLVFGLISHLELSLRELVHKYAPWPNWQKQLKPDSRRTLMRKLAKLKRARLELDALELTNFSDLVIVLAHQADLGTTFRNQMEEITQLRNDVAHAKTFIRSAEGVSRFVDQFVAVRNWIEQASRILREP